MSCNLLLVSGEIGGDPKEDPGVVEVVETVEVERKYPRVAWRGGPATSGPAGVSAEAELTTFKGDVFSQTVQNIDKSRENLAIMKLFLSED